MVSIWARKTLLRRSLALLLVLLPLTQVGCAYSTRPGKLRPGLQTVAVPYFENKSQEPGIEVELTEAILDGLIADRTLQVTDESDADALVIGTVRRYSFDEVFFSGDRQAEEYKISVEVEVAFVDRSTREAIVGPERIRGTGSYFVSEGPEGEEEARIEAANTIVEAIVNLVVEGW